jgi:hypothetical protein
MRDFLKVLVGTPNAPEIAPNTLRGLAYELFYLVARLHFIEVVP